VGLVHRLICVGVLGVSLLSGCAQQGQIQGLQSSSQSVKPARSLGLLTWSVFTSFETRPSGDYAIYVSAGYDIPLSSAAAAAQGQLEVDGAEIYYVATASEDAAHAGLAIHLVVDDSLAKASLPATLRVQGCTDEDGGRVTDRRCPVGQAIEVEVTWSSSNDTEQLGPPDSPGVYPGRGRKGTAYGVIGSNAYSGSTYSLIVENQTYQS
jgi:hypothetical protein